MVRLYTFLALLSARASTGKMPGLQTVEAKSVLPYQLQCGNPLNVPQPYMGCLADLQVMQVSSTQVVYKGFMGIVFSGFVVQRLRLLLQMVFSDAQACLPRNSKTVV